MAPAARSAFSSRAVEAEVAPSGATVRLTPFYSNCLQVGVLPVVLGEDAVDPLQRALRAQPGMRVAVDLSAQTGGGR